MILTAQAQLSAWRDPQRILSPDCVQVWTGQIDEAAARETLAIADYISLIVRLLKARAAGASPGAKLEKA